MRWIAAPEPGRAAPGEAVGSWVGVLRVLHGVLRLVAYIPEKIKVLGLKRNPEVAGRGVLNNAVAHCP